MLTDGVVLGKISSRWEKGGLFSSRWENQIGHWCVNYYNKYNKAPNKSIETIFDQWAADDSHDKATVELIERFLSGLSEEYTKKGRQKINPDHLVDVASDLFNKVRLRQLVEEVQGEVDAGAVKKALDKITNYRKFEIGIGSAVDVLSDFGVLKSAFDQRGEVLVTYPGAAGEFFGESLERDGLLAFMAGEKVGKTFWLVDLAWRAMLQGRRVAFFEVGDMSERQLLLRFGTRAAKHPSRKKSLTFKYPTRMDPDDPPKVHHKVMTFSDVLDFETTKTALVKLGERLGDTTLLRQSTHANDTITVNGIRSILDDWNRGTQAWSPDVVVIDYADLIAPVNGTAETRDQINKTWKGMRALSQELHVLVATATQAKAESYKAETLSKSHFSDDKRKLAHATAIVGLNQTPTEKENGVMRLNWIVLREDDFSIEKCVHVAGCLAVANPCIHSSF
jgi:hypothetical protein